MWSVLRRQQGEAYEASPPTKGNFQENLDHIARFECKPNPEPLDPHILTEPYGVRLYDKLIANLGSKDLILREKAVQAFIDYFDQKIDHVVRTIEYGGIPALVHALKDDDQEVRVKSCIALQKIVAHPKGQEEVLKDGLEIKLTEAIYDEPPVATEALRLLAAMDAHYNDRAGTRALIHAGCIDMYIKVIKVSPDEVKAEALIALSKVYNVKEAFIEVLEAGTMPVLSELLESKYIRVLEAAAENIALLCFYSAGKRAAVEDPKTTKSLIGLLEHGDIQVGTAASAALMAITIDNVGKELVRNQDGLPALMKIVELHEHEPMLINVIKTICNVSESPPARPVLMACVDRLREIQANTTVSMILKNTAARAVDMITWAA